MTDATQVPPALPTMPDPAQVPAATAAGGDGQSPLDMLDQILKDAQAKAAEATDAKLAEEEKKREEERERQRQLDAQKVQEELQQIEEMKTSPEYQAMMQQKQQAEEQKVAHDKQMSGMEIVQLKHTKV